MSMSFRLLVCTSLILLVAGCGRMDSHRYLYLDSEEGQTLRVPEQLDSPYRDETRKVPVVQQQSGYHRDPVALERPPGTLSVSSEQYSEYPNSELMLADEAANVWRRVSIALERSPLVNVLRRDDAGQRMQVELLPELRAREGGNWITRMIRRQPAASLPGPPVWVHVSAEGGSARIDVRDDSGRQVDDQSSRRVLGVISDRLG